MPRFRDLHDGRDINDTFVTNHPDERKTASLLVAGEIQY